MKSKTTISRENKSKMLRSINIKIWDILIYSKKSDFNLINVKELREVCKKINLWYEHIFRKEKVLKQKENIEGNPDSTIND